MSILDSFLGKVRAPYYCQITIDTRSGKLVMNYEAQDEGGMKTKFEKEYPTPMVTGDVVGDLLSWLKHTAVKFFGSESGGL